MKRDYVKIWNEVLTDVKFQNLTLSQQAQFLNLLIFVNIHGAGGALIVQPPAQVLTQILRCPDYAKLKHTLKRISDIFKGFSYTCNDKEDVIIFKNWHKYQIDDSSERVRRHRYLNVTKVTKKPISDEDFIQALKDNPAYKGIDIDKELSKMDAWFLTPAGRGRQKTHRFILMWLNKIEKAMEVNTDDKRFDFLKRNKEAGSSL